MSRSSSTEDAKGSGVLQSTFASVGRMFEDAVRAVGSVAMLSWLCLRSAFRRPFELRRLLEQIEELGIRSMSIAILTATFTGAVMSLQFAWGLSRFGAKEYVGRVVGITIVRELGPALTALMVGGRIGAGMAAEIGSMAVTEQLDAIRALGADPIKKLVLPRVLAAILVLPILTVIADVVAFAGAAYVTEWESGITAGFFMSTAMQTMRIEDFMSGLGKTFAFGYIIAIIGCRNGLCTTGGTESVGRSTTQTVVTTSILLLCSDFLLTKLFLML